MTHAALSADNPQDLTELVSLRRTLHRIPELSFKERETSQILKAQAARWGTVRPVAGTGFWVDIGPEIGRAHV